MKGSAALMTWVKKTDPSPIEATWVPPSQCSNLRQILCAPCLDTGYLGGVA